MITADQLKDVMDRADALHHYLNIDQKKVEFEEEQLRTQAPDFWEDPKYAQEQMKKVKDDTHIEAMDDAEESFWIPLSRLNPDEFAFDSIRKGLHRYLETKLG